ncbi:MAG TPA: hypothetical protein PKY59_26695 [Pyrinomonadaceae bacterium]|nr:hypothetical protein [Pyrinomonadaceae bacterium]
MPFIFIVRNFKKSLLFALIILWSANLQQTFANSVCELGKNDRLWIEKTVGIWEKVRKDSLNISAQKLPWLILFDANCVWNINPDVSEFSAQNSIKDKIVFGKKSYEVFGLKHVGKISLPENGEIPAQLISFASNYGNGEKAFLVSAMPSIWKNAPHLKDEKNVDALVRSVFVHEMTHTFHQKFHAKLDVIERKLKDVENFDDDIIQNTFAKTDNFRKAYEKEHELLFRAVAENDLKKKREMAKSVFEMIKSRRSSFFTGENSVYDEIEEIFLTMEGAANWAAYLSAIDQNLNQTDALKLIRRGGKWWSQDEGVGLFLLIDSLYPKWQKKAFGKSQMSVIHLLGEAVK